jgi:hypothetical protein
MMYLRMTVQPAAVVPQASAFNVIRLQTIVKETEKMMSKCILLSGLLAAVLQTTPSVAPMSTSFFATGSELSPVRTAVISSQRKFQNSDVTEQNH